jgi:phage replication-related protein YjqB (UPF0714/DUF867 family)
MTHRAIWDRRRFLGICAGLPTFACSDTGGNPFGKSDRFRATSVIEVRGLAKGQQLTKAGYCSVATKFAERVAIAPGDQVRIYRNADECALYTVSELRDEDSTTTIRMTKIGRERLGTSGSFEGRLDTQVTADELTDADARRRNEFVERLIDDGAHSGLLVAAAHGGMIEFNTDRQAEHLSSLMPGVSSWICKGWGDPDGAYTRWHVKSVDLSPNSFAGLGAIAHRGFKHVVSLHGMSAAGVIIGGRAPVGLREDLRAAIVDAIADPSVPVVVAGVDGPPCGFKPANFVNWLTADGEGGIQIEQSTTVRNLYWAEVAEAISTILTPLI